MGVESVKDIIELRRFLEGKYSNRDRAYRQLRQFYNADYWSGKPQISGIKLVYNLLANVVDRFTDFMSQPPDWRVLPMSMEEESLVMADKQEKLLYAQWGLNNINVAQQWQAHLQSLLGFFGFEILPETNNKANPEKLVKINVLNPDITYPMPKSDNIRDLDSVIMRSYDYTKDRGLFNPSLRQDQRRTFSNETKYYDNEKIVILQDDKEVLRIKHDFGFIPVVLGQNRVKPHFVEGVGDLDQAVGMNEYLNELLSWQADILEYSANPITIIKGHIGDTKLPTGPGSTWYGNENFRADFLSWPGQPPDVERMINRVIQSIQDMTSMSEPAIGRNIPSGTSGAAVQSLMSGIQATMLRKQVVMGDVYVHVNEVIFKMIERMFANKEILVRGTRKGNVFVEKFKGKEINGNYRNQAIWPPGVLDQASRVDIEIRKHQAGLQSRFTTMEGMGIISPKDEAELIRKEENESLQRELIKSGQLNPQQAEFDTAAQQLARDDTSQFGGPSEEQGLIQAVHGIDKVKGDVFFGGRQEEKLTLVLTNMNDKATIVNKLPPTFKGRIKFRPFKEDQDEELTPIVEQEEVGA